MKYSVLGLGYAPSEYDAERTEWMKHDIVFDFAETVEDAAQKLREQNYVCIAIRSDQISPREIAGRALGVRASAQLVLLSQTVSLGVKLSAASTAARILDRVMMIRMAAR